MTITSVGYAGTVGDAQWANMVSRVGNSTYSVDSSSSFQLAAAAGTRAASVSPGGASGMGIYDTSSATETINFASVSSGSRWDLVVLRRTWATKVTTIAIITGGASKVLPPRTNTPGTVDEQPLWLVNVVPGATIGEIVDLRCIAGPGGVLAFDSLARSYLDRVGTTVRIADTVWFRAVDVIGSPIWRSYDVTDTGWVNLALGPGWASYPGRPVRVRRLGKQVTIQGQLTRSSGDYGSMATIPDVFRPSIPGDLAYVGTAVGTSVSSVFPLALAVTSSGALTVPPGAHGAVNPDTVILSATWATE